MNAASALLFIFLGVWLCGLWCQFWFAVWLWLVVLARCAGAWCFLFGFFVFFDCCFLWMLGLVLGFMINYIYQSVTNSHCLSAKEETVDLTSTLCFPKSVS